MQTFHNGHFHNRERPSFYWGQLVCPDDDPNFSWRLAWLACPPPPIITLSPWPRLNIHRPPFSPRSPPPPPPPLHFLAGNFCYKRPGISISRCHFYRILYINMYFTKNFFVASEALICKAHIDTEYSCLGFCLPPYLSAHLSSTPCGCTRA